MERERRDFDQAIKDILLNAHDGVLQLLGLGDAIWEQDLDTELVAPRRHADVVWRIMLYDVAIILHIEVQTLPDAMIAARMAEYGMRIWVREQAPILSVVLYLKPTENIPVSPFTLRLPDGAVSFAYHFRVLKLWELAPGSVLQTPYANLWPLAVLMAGTNTQQAVQVAQQIATAPLSTEDRERLEGLVVLFAGLRMPVEPLAKLLEDDTMLRDIFRASSLHELLMREVGDEKLQQGIEQGREIGRQQGIEQGREIGRQQGIEQGREQGKAVGRVATLRQLVVRFAEQRFATLSETARQAIGTYEDADRLQEALFTMADFADEGALLAFLAEAAQP
jgi:predicted transposase YdaD